MNFGSVTDFIYRNNFNIFIYLFILSGLLLNLKTIKGYMTRDKKKIKNVVENNNKKILLIFVIYRRSKHHEYA